MALTISGYAWARWNWRKFAAILTIEDPVPPLRLRIAIPPAQQHAHLILQFSDLNCPQINGNRDIYRLAENPQIAEGLEFGRLHDDLLIHCEFGLGRAPALAMGILMERLHDEQAVFAELQRLRPYAVPNRHVVNLVDDILNSNLSAGLDAWDARNQWSLLRCLMWRNNGFTNAQVGN